MKREKKLTTTFGPLVDCISKCCSKTVFYNFLPLHINLLIDGLYLYVFVVNFFCQNKNKIFFML